MKTPKVQATDAQAKTPDPTIIRNPYLDGTDPLSKSLRTGSSSLRIERTGRGAAKAAPPVSVAPLSSLTPQLNPQLSQAKITPVRGGASTGGRINRVMGV